jgi:hypothetical protein
MHKARPCGSHFSTTWWSRMTIAGLRANHVQRGNVEYECSIPHCIFTSCNRVASLVSSAIHVRAAKFTFVIRQFNPQDRCRQQATVENRQVTTCAMVATMLAFFARLFLGWPISVRSIVLAILHVEFSPRADNVTLPVGSKVAGDARPAAGHRTAANPAGVTWYHMPAGTLR